MPNHVLNEIIFRDVDAAAQDALLAKIRNAEGHIDFEVLLPTPINSWPFNVGQKHEKAFKNTDLDWCRDNWGTKWNAYSQKEIQRTDDTLTLIFETAWRPPYGWLCAVFRTFQNRFEHNWLDEGASRGWSAIFNWSKHDDRGPGEAWSEERCNDAMQRHLHKLHWGVEEFPPEPDDAHTPSHGETE